MEPKNHKCPECRKSFYSAKALHGHMRKHPERSYRGINPPSPTSGAAAPDMTKEPRPITLRERMEAFYEDWDTESYYEGDGADYEARYWRCIAESESKKKTEEEEVAPVTVVASEATPTATTTANTATDRAATATSKETLTVAPTAAAPSKKRKLVREIAESWGHLCDTCGKTFPSPQALGGHKTCHRKTNATSSLSATGEAKVGEDAGKAKAHVCKICQKAFRCGQALGGHQRLHYEGPLHKSAGKGKVEKSMSGSSSASINS